MEMDVYQRASWKETLKLGIIPVLMILIHGVKSREYCNNEPFHVSCGEQEVIEMTSGFYGRKEATRCIQKEEGCGVNVLTTLHQVCSGKKECQINTPLQGNFKDSSHNCGDDDVYLEASHNCIPIATVHGSYCSETPTIYAPPPPLHLSNLMTSSSCQRHSLSWTIEVNLTQMVNLSLLDFGEKQQNGDCVNYGDIVELSPYRHSEICGGQAKWDYISYSNKVTVTMKPPKEINNVRFLLAYSVIGCPTPALSPGMAIRRGETHEVVVFCKSDPNETWEVTCRDKRWDGKLGNCTVGGNPVNPVLDFFKNLKGDTLIYVIAGSAIVIVLVILIIIMACWRRCRPDGSDYKDVYEMAVRRGKYPVAMRSADQQNQQQEQQCKQKPLLLPQQQMHQSDRPPHQPPQQPQLQQQPLPAMKTPYSMLQQPLEPQPAQQPHQPRQQPEEPFPPPPIIQVMPPQQHLPRQQPISQPYDQPGPSRVLPQDNVMPNTVSAPNPQDLDHENRPRPTPRKTLGRPQPPPPLYQNVSIQRPPPGAFKKTKPAQGRPNDVTQNRGATSQSRAKPSTASHDLGIV